MTRRSWLLTLACVSCGRRDAIPPPPPAQLPGGFSFASAAPLPDAEVPEAVRAAGLASAQRAVYTGPAPLTVSIYEMRSGPSAFELVQKQRPSPGALSFHTGSRFVVVESAGLGQPELNAAAKAIESHFESRQP